MNAPVFESPLRQREGPVLTITLHRPLALNAMTAAMRHEVCHALDLADADDAVRAIVFTGSGRSFCAGFGLWAGSAAFDKAAGPPPPADEVGRDGGGILALRLFASPKLPIGAVNGAAVGIGASMLLPMDIRIASTAARFGFVFARRGIVPEACASWFLPRVVGISRAVEWATSGRLLGAVETLAGGLRETCEPDRLLARADALAHEAADRAAPVSVAVARQLMWRRRRAAHPMQAHRVESYALFERGASADASEGVAAFLGRRAPAFPDRVSADLPACYPWWVEPAFDVPDSRRPMP